MRECVEIKTLQIQKKTECPLFTHPGQRKAISVSLEVPASTIVQTLADDDVHETMEYALAAQGM